MPTDEVRYVRPGDPDVAIERHRMNQSGSAGGGTGGGDGGSGGASSGGSSGSGGNSDGSGGSTASNQQSRQQPQQPQSRQRSQFQPSQNDTPNSDNGSSSQKETPMHNTQPIVVAGAAPFASPYAYPYGFGAPVAPVAPGGGPVTVVTGADGGRGTHSQLETLSDIALGGLRESAAAGRTSQLSTQIAQLGDRLGMESGFSRELTTQKQFTDATRERGDLENRLLSAIKDESIRTREMFTNERINALQAENTSLRESRRFQELDNDLSEIKRLLREKA